jgi:phosphomannomutase / phosphoglucomutase
MLNPSVFREYDIRGIADRELLDPDVELLGRALATHIIRHSGHTICLGRDCRLSGERIHAALLKGLLAAGAAVLDIGIVPTPVLYYAAIHFAAHGAVMITGSHNQPECNGFKTVSGLSTLYGDQIQGVLKLIQSSDYESGEGGVKEVDAVTPYVEEIGSQFKFERKVKVVFDAGNGTTGPVLRRLLETLNVEPVELFFEMDGRFPNHHPDPTVAENLRDLQQSVKKNKAELGVAFDGDSDRIGAVDEKGKVLYGDMLLLIFGREILTRKPGAAFIGEVKCSQILYDKLAELGGRPIMYRTGHSLIKAKMKQEHAELAGEMSGHMFFSDRYYGYDDAIYAALRLIEIVTKSGKPLSSQLEGLPKLVSTAELRIDCPDDKKFLVVEKVAALIGKTYPIVDVDGVRVNYEKGWGLVRASNTEPALVMRFEAESQELLDRYRAELEQIVDQAKAAV